jgi:hypothetical protein
LVKSLKIDHINLEEQLIEKFKRRGKRFMDIINCNEFHCMFFYVITLSDILDKKIFNEIMRTINLFIDTMNNYSKCQYILIIFITMNINDYDEVKNTICEFNKKSNGNASFLKFK